MANNKLTIDELNNVNGGYFKEIKEVKSKTCICGSANVKKITKTENCSDVDYYHCNDCGHEDLYKNLK